MKRSFPNGGFDAAKRPKAGTGTVGEIRFENADEAREALAMDGGDFQGSTIGVDLDMLYQDGTKLLITNLPAGAAVEDLKDSFSVFGRIQYAGIDGGRLPPAAASRPVPSSAGPTRSEYGGVKGRPAFGGPSFGGSSFGAPGRGTVRFETPSIAEEAAAALDGQDLRGSIISARLDPSSKDGTKIFVDNLEPSVEWQDLKDFCAQVGAVAFVKVDKMPMPAHGGKGVGGAPQAPMASNLAPFAESRRPVPQFARRPPAQATSRGEVRFERREDAARAMAQLNGTMLGAAQMFVQPDESSKDGTRVIVSGLPASVSWQVLKDHFNAIGPVAYCKVAPAQAEEAAAPWHGGFESQPPPPPMLKAIGEVRYESAAAAEDAKLRYSGMEVHGHIINVKADLTSRDGTRVLVMGWPAAASWQELKHLLSAAYPVAHAKVQELPGAAQAAAPKPAMLGMMGRPAMAPPPTMARPTSSAVGEVRFDTAEDAQLAAQRVNGTYIGGQKVSVQLDPEPRAAGKKVRIYGLQPSFRWQELKDHFARIAPVAFADVAGAVDGPPLQMGGMAKGKGKQSRAPIRSEDGSCGEVRYSTASDAQSAIAALDGSMILGAQISVTADSRSQDGTKLLISNLPAGVEWQELKGHFAQCGEVAYAGVFGPGEVWMATPAEAEEAVNQLNGAEVDGQEISVRIDETSNDFRKLIVNFLPPHVQWQELKDLFRTVGEVKHAVRAR